MSAKKEMIGKKFGRLVVVSEVIGRKSPSGFVLYNCTCECGEVCEKIGAALRTGKTQSCGCYHKERVKYVGLSTRKSDWGERRVYKMIEQSAKKRGLDFTLSREYINELIKMNCYYCSSKPNNIFKNRDTIEPRPDYYYNGIDRIDSSVGYIKGNVRPSCFICNKMKSNYSEDVFLRHIKSIIKELGV